MTTTPAPGSFIDRRLRAGGIAFGLAAKKGRAKIGPTMTPMGPPNAVTDDHHQQVNVKGAADHLGIQEVLDCQVGGEHHREHVGSLAASAVAEAR
ncbi:MAG TPA: hypothetical protein VF241_02330 [Propionibacteriaceae bacterium]